MLSVLELAEKIYIFLNKSNLSLARYKKSYILKKSCEVDEKKLDF